MVALYTDDDFGNNGIDALGDALQAVGSTIVFKASLDPKITKDGIGRMLTKLSQMESRVFVVHMEPNVGRDVFLMAEWLQMVSGGYVWIVTEAMSSIMDYLDTDPEFLNAVQGVIGTRSYIPPSRDLHSYRKRWEEKYANNSDLGPAQMNNVYAWYAYDAVWLIAHAIQILFAQGGSATFVDPVTYPNDAGGNSELTELKVFQDGQMFKKSLLGYQFNGITGPVQMDQRGDYVGSSFEILNMWGKGLRVVGYWSNSTGCLPFAPAGNLTPVAAVSHALGHHSSKSWVSPMHHKPLYLYIINTDILGCKFHLSFSILDRTARSKRMKCVS